MKTQHYEIRLYEAPDGSEPFSQWMQSLRDRTIRVRIQERLNRLTAGNFGDCKLLKHAEGIYELRFYFGPGYRVYFGIEDQAIVLLLMGGDKSSQTKDIRKSISYWNEYKSRTIQ